LLSEFNLFSSSRKHSTDSLHTKIGQKKT